MDFKNFIDILSTPKNIGSNKWVLSNFSDLKSSNDYLHIIRLRYDNRWLRVYWDGKLKEVEKDFNFSFAVLFLVFFLEVVFFIPIHEYPFSYNVRLFYLILDDNALELPIKPNKIPDIKFKIRI